MRQRLLALLFVAAAVAVAAGGGAFLAFREPRPAVRPVPVETLSDRDQARGSSPVSTNATVGVPEAKAPADAKGSTSPGSVTAPPVQPRPARAVAPAGRSSSTIASAAPRAPGTAQPAREPAAREIPPPPLAVPEAPLPVTQVAALPAATPVAPEPEFVDVTVPAESVIGLQIGNTLTSETARLEDRVEARVTRDVRADGRIAIPAGSRMEGVVTVAERGGKFKERARLAVRFHTLVLTDGTRVPVQTDTIYREGESPARDSTAKIGGAAVGGALLGAILGGGKGAAIGSSIGAAGGTAMVMAGDRDPAILPAGASVTVRLHAPVTIAVER